MKGVERRSQVGQMVLVSTAHITADTYLGFVAVLLPFLVPRWGLSLTKAGALATALLAATYFAQPLFGLISDRRGARGFLVAGPSIIACFVGSMVLLPTFEWAILWVVLGGLGSAAFHPPAAGLAHRMGGNRRSLAMSIFLMSGFLGVALGPLEILTVVTRLGLNFAYLTILPGLVISVFLWKYALVGKQAGLIKSKRPPLSELLVALTPLSGLWAMVVLRNFTHQAIATFLPLMLKSSGLSVWAWGTALSLFLTAGAVGGIVGGYLSDYFNRKVIIVVTNLLSAVCLGVFVTTAGVISIVFLVLGGFFLLMSSPINLVVAQEMFPTHANFLASMLMGFAYGMGSLAVVGVGWVADRVGIPISLAGVIIAPLICVWLGFLLPRAHVYAGKDVPVRSS